MVLSRRRGSAPGVGSCTPVDALRDAAAATVRLGVREPAGRLNQGARSPAKAADNLQRAAQVHLSDEWLRPVVEAEGQAVLKARRRGQLTVTWSAAAGQVPAADGQPTPAPRWDLGADGVKVPLVTEAEQQTRRAKTKQKRRRRGRRCRRLPKARPGADQRAKEFKLVTYYDQTQAHRHVSGTRGDCQAAGDLIVQRNKLRL